MLPVEIEELLHGSGRPARKRGWKTLWEQGDDLDLGYRGIADLEEIAAAEPVAEIGAFAMGVIAKLRRKPPGALLEKLWEPFRSSSAIANAKESAVIAVCDGYSVRDATPLITLAQRLPGSRDIKFHLVPFDRPDWHQIDTSLLRSVCLVGRPLMFRGFPLAHNLPKDLRFAFPPGDHRWRGKPMTNHSILEYHHLEQKWSGKKVRSYEPSEETDRVRKTKVRLDYAVVQRFPVTFGIEPIVVIILGGVTSLGTAGAVAWATSGGISGQSLRNLEHRAGALGPHTCVEALLEVTAERPTPRRPWRPQVREEKLFINGSPNLVQAFPETITLQGGAAGAGKVQAIFLDHYDGVSLEGDKFEALVALCLAANRGNGIADAEEIIRNDEFWPEGAARPCGVGSAMTYLDNFQRKLLNGCLHKHDKNKLRLQAKIILT